MSIKLADTLAPLADFPAAMAEHIEFDDGKSLQEKYDLGELGGEGGSSENYYEVSVKVKFNTLYNTVSCSNYSGRYQDIKDAYDRGDKIKLLVDYSFTSEADVSYQYGLDLAFVNVNDGSFNFELVDKNNNHCLITIDANNSISVIL